VIGAYVGAQHALSPVVRIEGTTTYRVPSATEQQIAIPALESGGRPEYITITGPNIGTYFKFGDSTVDATTGGVLIQPQSNFFPIAVGGQTHISFISPAATALGMHVTAVSSLRHPGSLKGFRPAKNATLLTGLSNVATHTMTMPTAASGKKASVVMIWGDASVFCKPAQVAGSVHSSRDGIRMKSGYPTVLDVTGYSVLMFAAESGVSNETSVAVLEV